MGLTYGTHGSSTDAQGQHDGATKPDRSKRSASTARKLVVVIKYLITLAAYALASKLVGDWRYLAAATLEIAAVALLCNWLAGRNVVVANVVNGLLMLVLNVQAAVLIFASGYTSVIMLSNLFNLEDLAGKALVYALGAVFALVVSFLPIVKIELAWAGGLHFALACGIAAELVASQVVGVAYAPLASAVSLAHQWAQYQDTLARVGAASAQVDPTTTPYYQADLLDGISSPSNLPEQPNVVVIFTEGLSQHIVDDKREIMPNVSRYQKRSLTFDNYYNHTAATFRALNGQLYSGFQLNDNDANALISLQGILHDQGYHTAFVNPEPHFLTWVTYLEQMGFDELVGESATGTYTLSDTGTVGAKMSDGDAYKTLQATMERLGTEQQPFFVAIYTFGTHVSYDSPEEKYGDGSNAMLNKFYNCDYQFGQFMQWFEQSDLSKNTIVVFTTDHATYTELDYQTTFPKYERTQSFLDSMPCFYYYQGVQPQHLDAAGRSTLDFAPTLLDYLDVSAPNCFLGRSLFLEDDPADLDTYFFDGAAIATSEQSKVRSLEGEEQDEIRNRIMDYLSCSRISLGEDPW